MANDNAAEMAAGDGAPQRCYGALADWTHQDLGDRVVVCLQSKGPPSPDSEAPLDEFHYMMTKNQAAVLANYLFGLSGRLPQQKPRFRWFR